GKLGASYKHTCALRNDGKAACWGYNSSRQLGTGNTSNANSPFVISTLAGATFVDAGYSASCVVYGAAGNVACSGDGQSSTFVNVGGGSGGGDFTGAVAVAVGSGFKCLVTTAGAPLCWGVNDVGQLGNGIATVSLTPVPVIGQPLPGCATACTTGTVSGGVSQIVAANNHACLLTSGGYVQCWGESGATGFNVETHTASTVLAGVMALDTGDNHTCAVMMDQTVQCW